MIRYLMLICPILLFGLIGLGCYYLYTEKQKLRNFQFDHFKLFTILLYLWFILFSIILVFWIDASIHYIWNLKCIGYDPIVMNALITAQAAGLIFAITLTLIIVQLHSNIYFSRVIEVTKGFFDMNLIISIYVFSMLFDAILVIYQDSISFKSEWLIVLAIGLFLGAVLSLIPYRRNMFIFLRPENILIFMEREIKANISDVWLRRNHLIGIFDVVISSLEKCDLETAESGLERIKEIFGIGRISYLSPDEFNIIIHDERIQKIFLRSVDAILTNPNHNRFEYIIIDVTDIKNSFLKSIKQTP